MSFDKDNLVYLCVWSGEAEAARGLARGRFPAAQIEEFAGHGIRGSSLSEQLRVFRRLRGKAAVFYFATLSEFKHVPALLCLHLLHRCRETVLCDDEGQWQSWTTTRVFFALPRCLFSIARDLKSLIFWWCYLRLLLSRNSPVPMAAAPGELQIAYLIPSIEDPGSNGGAISHIRGFLHGLSMTGKTCRVFTGTALEQESFRNEVVVPSGKSYFFWEAAMLRYNFQFVQAVAKDLAGKRTAALYQRHCRFAVGGALLAKRLGVPLILEYNGPQRWIADHWDPTPFKRMVSLCEEVSLRSAGRIVVVSEALREELSQRGIAPERIRLNPNGVDTDFFAPGRARTSGRARLRATQDELIVGFVGSFSLWHGIDVLQRAIVKLLQEDLPCRLRFVLVGDGLLREEMRAALREHEKTERVIFTGTQPRERVLEYLDASDILVSPHVPMPDGSRFFGSPTKLFEYMAMGKGIVASRLEQIADVLEHERTALLVTPGDADEFAAAIVRLALEPEERAAFGSAARRMVTERYTWSHNVATALDNMPVERRQFETVTL